MIDSDIFEMNITKAMHRIETLYDQTDGAC